MSERQYFSLRYAIPGYVFLLLLIAVNYVPLMHVLSVKGYESAFGAFLAFLSLFTGSALGFIISQFHWWWFKRPGRGFFAILKLEHLRDEIKNTYPFRAGITDSQLECIYDYAFQQEENQNIREYAQRRWDMYHTLAATKLALFVGSVVAIFFRIYYQVFLFNCSIMFSKSMVAEIIALLFVYGIAAMIYFVLSRGLETLQKDYRLIAEAYFRRVRQEIDIDKLRAVFPSFLEPP